MMILEPNGRLDRLPRRSSWCVRLLAWIFGARGSTSHDTTKLDTPVWLTFGMQDDDATASGRI